MDASAPGMDEILRAVGMVHAGDREPARAELLRLWHQWRDRDAPLQRCTIAHFAADIEEDAAAELEWDLRALEAATGFRDDEDHAALDPALESFLPSLHLNVGDAWRRLGDRDRALRHAGHGLQRAGLLGEDGYGGTVRAGLERLRARSAGGANDMAR